MKYFYETCVYDSPRYIETLLMSAQNYGDINMNIGDYNVRYIYTDTDDTPYALCRGVNLYSPRVLQFEEWITLELDRRLNDINPNSPYPYVIFRYTGNGPGVLCPVFTDERNFIYRLSISPWSSGNQPSLICFIQAQARKIQKCWRNLTTEVAMPCAEDVE